MNADVMGNEYNIDPANIGYFGEGTGGYVSYAASTISDYNDIILDDTVCQLLNSGQEHQVLQITFQW